MGRKVHLVAGFMLPAKLIIDFNFMKKNLLVAVFVFLIVIAVILFVVLITKPSEDSSALDSQSQLKNAKSIEIEKELSQIEVVSAGISLDIIGTPNLDVSFKNNSEKTIDALVIKSYLYNNFDEPVGKWNSNSADPFYGNVQEEIAPNQTKTLHWNLAVYGNATKTGMPIITKIHFTDGETVSQEDNSKKVIDYQIISDVTSLNNKRVISVVIIHTKPLPTIDQLKDLGESLNIKYGSYPLLGIMVFDNAQSAKEDLSKYNDKVKSESDKLDTILSHLLMLYEKDKISNVNQLQIYPSGMTNSIKTGQTITVNY